MVIININEIVSTMVIPVTEWESDGNSKILGYECPKCGYYISKWKNMDTNGD